MYLVTTSHPLHTALLFAFSIHPSSMSLPVDAKPRDAESDSLLPTGKREDAFYPTGYVAPGDERIRDGRLLRTIAGLEYPISVKVAIEFIGTLFFMFFGVLSTVNSAYSDIVLVNSETTNIMSTVPSGTGANSTNSTVYTPIPATVQFLNQATGLHIVNNGGAVISNPLANFLSAIIWAILLVLTLRALPGAALNPWVSLNHWFFLWKKSGEKLQSSHISHALAETMWVILAQFSGGILAIICVYFIVGRDTSQIGETLPSPTLSNEAEVIIYEGIASFLFMLGLTIVAKPRRDITAAEQTQFAGLAVLILTLAFGTYTGCSLNVVRTFAPALVRSIFSAVPMRLSVLYYILGQAIGYALAGVVGWLLNSDAMMKRFQAVTTNDKEE